MSAQPGKFRIARVIGRQVWDSRGRPTVEAEIELAGGARAHAIAPAGASTGSGEAIDLRDGGKAFGGRGVCRAVGHVSGEIAKTLAGLDARDQALCDKSLILLDGTADKSRLGGNALIATSLAIAHAAAVQEGVALWRWLADGAEPLIPLPEIQIFGGGAHATGSLDIQDFMVVCPAAENFAQALEWTARIYHAAGALLADKGLKRGVADEGGHWPMFDTNSAALDMLVQAIESAGFRPGDEVAISLDVAASEFGGDGNYSFEGKNLNTEAFADRLSAWLRHYPIRSVEDPLAEDDYDGMAAFTTAHGRTVQIVGDDYLVTNAQRIERAARAGACNAALIKPNQAGTLTETRAAFDAARRVQWRTIVSARSGESEDISIAHLAVGWAAGQLKVGSFARSERMAKWNEVLRIEEALGSKARFASRLV
jgi:enolase